MSTNIKSSIKIFNSLIKNETKSELIKYAPKRLPPLLTIGDLLKLYKVKSTKKLSQNFLLNPRLSKKLVQLSGIQPGSHVLEIGPGPGCLTRFILEQSPKELIVIEKDRRFLPILEMLSDIGYPGQMKIMLGDVLDYNLDNIFSKEHEKEWGKFSQVFVIGNLPYSISTVFLIKILKQMYNRNGIFSYGKVRLSLTFQLEVAKRITAPVLNNYRSRLSVMTQLFSQVKLKKKIKAESFVPSPLVDSGYVKFYPLEKPLIQNVPFEVIENFVKILFHLRNAYSSKSIKYLFPAKKQYLTFEMFKKCDLNPQCTPLMLSNEDIVNLIKVYWEFCQEFPELLEQDYRQIKNEPKLIRKIFSELGGSQRLIDEAIKKEFFLIEDNKVLTQ